MKRCSTCNRTYTDPNLSYCIDDGTPLTTDFAEDAPYRPPSAYVPPGNIPTGKQRRAWPWIVGVMGAFILGAVVLMVAVAVFVPRMVRSRQANPPAVVTTNERDQQADPPVAVNTNEKDQTEDAGVAAPTDEQQVLAQLTDIENEWTVANLNADKQKLDRILADDYVGQAAEGGLQGKKEYLKTIERNTSVEKWEFADLKLHLAGDRATLTGTITLFSRGRQDALNFTDKFVWRDGRWQATGSEVVERK
jgi:hypothetical protein